MAYKGVRVRYILAGTALVSAAAGAGVSYLVTDRIVKRKYEEIAAAEIATMKDHYEQVWMEGDYSSPIKLAAKIEDDPEDGDVVEEPLEPELKEPHEDPELQAAFERLKAHSEEKMVDYGAVTRVEEDIEPEGEPAADQTGTTKSIWEYPGWDQQAEESMRSKNPLAPYVISQDEYFENTPGFEQTTLTYHAKDDTLADEKSQPIEDHTAVGDDNLNRFGHGSRDPKIVHVRNESLSLDFEIVRSEGSFAEDVFGFTPTDGEIKHGQRRVGKFREARAE